MKESTKYIALAAAFVVGLGSAIGYQVHAQVKPVTPAPATVAPVQTSQQDPKNTDGETADDSAAVQSTQQDPQNTDGETADDASVTNGGAKASVTADTAESEHGAADVNEVEDGK